MNLIDLSGWVGAILVLVAYYMVTSGKAEADSYIFQVVNIIGAGFLIYYTYNCKAYASMTVNILWVLIGVQSFIKFIKVRDFKTKILSLRLKKAQQWN